MSNLIPAINLAVDPADLVQADRVHTSLYTDPALFDAELEKIFHSTWIWVAHESEIPDAGSYKTTYIGKQPVIVVRDRKKDIHVLLNRCRHRGATVCEHKKGKTNSFVCPYHGWGYALDGSLRGIPHPESYGDCIDKAELPLVSLRTERYAGMVFATFKDDIEPLEDFLGAAKKWMDLFMKQGAGYGIKVPGEHRFRFPGNWKIQLENTTDAYHFPLVHKSFLSSVDEQTMELFDFVKGPGYVEDLGNGHSVMVMIPELIDLEADLDKPIPERFEALAAELRDEGIDEQQVRRIVRAVGGTGFNLNLFPNIACSMAFFRALQPISVTETEIHHSVITMDGGPAAANRYRLRLHEHFQGPMGFGTPDDSEAWERVQKGASAGEDLWIMLNRGLPGEQPSEDGLVSDVSAETGMRAAYQQWKKDDVGLTVENLMNLQLLQEVTAFIWQEGDMLDHGEYDGWLKQWTEKGTYIIPIDPRARDHENTLNYAYDDHHMRQLRVQRLIGGESISTSPQPRTVRSISRIRVLDDDGVNVTVRAAQNVREFRKESLKHYSADLTYSLVRAEGGFKIHRKVISLINSDDTLAGIGYIL